MLTSITRKFIFKIIGPSFYKFVLWNQSNWQRLQRKIIKQSFAQCGPDAWLELPVFITGSENIYIGNHFGARSNLRIEAISNYRDCNYSPKIEIGDNVHIESNCHIGCIKSVKIGNGCLIASRVFITDHFHGNIAKEEFVLPPLLRPLFSKGPVIIGNNVWIGEGAVILPGVTIGDNAIIGANSVVTHNIPLNSVIGGIPGRILKQF